MESIALSSSIRIVPESTTRGTVYQRSNLPELMDGSTSSRVATDYHLLIFTLIRDCYCREICFRVMHKSVNVWVGSLHG